MFPLKSMKLKLLFILLLISGFAHANNPTPSWINTFKSYDNQTITKTLTDNKGNVYTVGTFRTSLTFGNYTIYSYGIQNIYIVKYDSSGKFLWAKNDCTGEGGLNLNSAAIDKSGNIILCGDFYSNQKSFGSIVLSNSNPSGPTKYFVVKYNSDGNVLWAKSNSTTISYTSALSVVCDNLGNIFVAGTFQDNTINFGSFVLNKTTKDYNNIDGFLVKLDATGNFIWASVFSGDGRESATNMASDPSGNVYITGQFNGYYANFGNSKVTNSFYIGYGDVFLAKCNSNGEFIWARGAKGGRCQPNSIIIDYLGNIYLGGQFMSHELKFDQCTLTNSNSLNYNDWKGFMVKFAPNGSAILVKQSSNETVGDLNTSMCIDKYGFIYSTGYFTSATLTLDNIILTKSAQTGQDMYFCKYNTNGKVIWAQNVGCSYSSGVSVAVDNSGNLFLGGLYGLNDPKIYQPFNYFKLTNDGDFVAKILGDTSRLSIDHFYCKEDFSTTLAAPDNNYYYTWIDSNNKVLSNSQSITINNLVDSAVYTCKFKNIQDSIMIWTYTLVKNQVKADFSSSLSDCKTNTVQFSNLSTTNLGSLTYLWNFGDGTSSTELNPLHRYTSVGNHQVGLLITNTLSGCVDSMRKTITYYPKPTIKIVGDSTICHGIPVILKAQGAATYKWSTGSTSDSIKTANPQKVWVVGTSASGCISDTAFISVIDITAKVSITGNASYCPGFTTTLKAHGANHYEWSNGSKADSIKIGNETTVWVLGYNTSCTSDTVKYKVILEPDFSLWFDGNLYLCTGGNTVLTAHGADLYSWSTGEKTNSITINKSGDYSVTGVSKRGCEKTISMKITETQLPSVDFSVYPATVDTRHNTVKCSVSSLLGVDYKWDMGDGYFEYGSDIQHSYTVSNALTGYKITLTATNIVGCVNSAEKSVDIVLFVPNIFSPNGDGVNDVFMPDVEMEIFDRNGVSLYKGTSGWDGNFHGSKMPDDTYYYAITWKDKNGKSQLQKGYVILKR